VNILSEIAEKTRERVEIAKRRQPLSALRSKAEAIPVGDFAFSRAVSSEGLSFICEVKRASPSKGLIAEDFPYRDIALEYESAGASAISVLTEPFWFKGRDEYLTEISNTVKIPLLRKDFTVDEYMIYEAKTLGASAVLLICAILDDGALSDFVALSNTLGLSALVEAHDERETERALKAEAEIIGVNNRDLKTFKVDLNTAARLRRYVPKDRLFVAESGINSAEDVRLLKDAGADAVLIGERLMTARDKTAALAELRSLI